MVPLDQGSVKTHWGNAGREVGSFATVVQNREPCSSAISSSVWAGKFGYWAVGTLREIDKNHVFWRGQSSGTFFNDAGSGFMDHISLLCPGVNDIVNGESMSAHGYCTGTDKDGDELFYV